jgi:hypothetical protein
MEIPANFVNKKSCFWSTWSPHTPSFAAIPTCKNHEITLITLALLLSLNPNQLLQKSMRNYAMTNITQAKPTSPAMAAIQRTSLENKKWILVGAQQAGASPKRMAEIASLPKGTVRRILSNFSRTGIPSMSSPRSHACMFYSVIHKLSSQIGVVH